MTAPHILNPAAVLDNALSGDSPDLMRNLHTTVINALLSAEADAVCGAEYGQPSPERVNSRNGYRHRELDTRAGTIDVAVPKLRAGSFFPEWLLERRKRAEAALISVVATCYLLGVSTRRMDNWSPRWGSPGCPSRQVSEMTGDVTHLGVICLRASCGAPPAPPYPSCWDTAWFEISVVSVLVSVRPRS
jgi:putative transposase